MGTYYGTVSFGSTTLSSTLTNNGYVAKWSTVTNTFVWCQATSNSRITAVAVNGSSVYITGSFSNTALFGSLTLSGTGSNFYVDAFVAKLTDSGLAGTVVWVQKAGGTNDDFATGVAVNGNNVYITGNFSSSTAAFGSSSLVNMNTGLTDVFVAKLTDTGPTGTFVWAQRAGGTSNDEVVGIAASGPNVFITGTSSDLNAAFGTIVLRTIGLFVAKLVDAGASGNFLWVQQASGTGSVPDINPMAIAASGSQVYITGGFASATATFGTIGLVGPNTYPDIFIAKLTDVGSTGNFTWVQRVGGPRVDYGIALAVQGTQVYVAGHFDSSSMSLGPSLLTNTGNGSNAFVAKLIDSGTTSTVAWAQQSRGVNYDGANAISLSGTNVYVSGTYTSSVINFGTIALTGPTNNVFKSSFLVSLTDPTLLATNAPQGNLSFSLAPNPARAATTVLLPVLPGTATATLTLRDALGRTLRTSTVALPAAGLRHELDLMGLAPGLYAVEVQAGSFTGTRHLVVE
ncbi:hypothetical protein GCM10027345_38420 [Hymenobacter daeguensis]